MGSSVWKPDGNGLKSEGSQRRGGVSKCEEKEEERTLSRQRCGPKKTGFFVVVKDWRDLYTIINGKELVLERLNTQ